MLINDNFIKKTSLALSIIGIIALLVLSQTIEAQNVAIGDITGNMIGNKVKVTGIITEIYWHDGHLFLTISQNRNDIMVVMFERDAKKYPALQNLTKNDEVTVSGSVNEYERELEIVAKEIVIIK